MKIVKKFNKKEKRYFYHARFELNKKAYFPKAESKQKLLEIIDEIRSQVRRKSYNLETFKIYPTFESLLNRHKTTMTGAKLVTFNRISGNLLNFMPDQIKVTDLKKAYFQTYIDWRLNQISQKTKESILPQTVDKELFAISKALSNAPLYFPELEDYQKIIIPKASKGKKKRERTQIIEVPDLEKLLAELRRDKSGKQTYKHIHHRQRLADELEFKFETGLRRKEVVRLLKSQYSKKEGCLRNVIRFKTDSVTKFFPLSNRAIQIIENRLKINNSDYLFSENGEPVPADYRTLKKVCQQIGVKYGIKEGFIPHDLRRNFATAISLQTDIETTRELLGHTNIKQTSTYLGTNQNRLVEAVRPNLPTKQIIELYKHTKRGKIKLKEFIKNIENLIKKKTKP